MERRRWVTALSLDLSMAWRHLALHTVAGSPLVPRAVRASIYRAYGLDVRTRNVFSGVRITGRDLHVGQGTFINHECYLDVGNGRIDIGDDCHLAPGVMILTATHTEGAREERSRGGVPHHGHRGPGLAGRPRGGPARRAGGLRLDRGRGGRGHPGLPARRGLRRGAGPAAARDRPACWGSALLRGGRPKSGSPNLMEDLGAVMANVDDGGFPGRAERSRATGRSPPHHKGLGGTRGAAHA